MNSIRISLLKSELELMDKVTEYLRTYRNICAFKLFIDSKNR